MHAIIIVSSKDQDQSLSVAFQASMTEKGWESIQATAISFTKSFVADSDKDSIAAQIKQDVEEAAYDAEWTKVNYTFLVSSNSPKHGITK